MPAETSSPESPTGPDAVDGVEAVEVIPSELDRHLLSRFSYGVSQALIKKSNAQGGAGSWFENQLAPSAVPDDFADGLSAWWPMLSWTPEEMWDDAQNGGRAGWEQQNDHLRWTLLRRMYSQRQVHEVMTEFWSNLLHVSSPLPKTFPLRTAYDATIREHALGTYEDLLTAAVLDPAMLCYLDNERSSAENPNENLGRELLELHTVGPESGFTEAHVFDSAMILTGWQVDTDATWEPVYNELEHYVGRVKVLEFNRANTSPNGRQLTLDYLSYLARHESTAQRVARRLAVRFVSDTPSEALVDHVAQVFLDSGTDIKATLRALVAHADFDQDIGGKVKTPNEDILNTYRVMQLEVLPPTSTADLANMILVISQNMGQRPFDWPRPDGFPDNAFAWSSASRILASWQVHKSVSNGGFPSSGVIYKPAADWLPVLPMRFDDLVDRFCRQILGQKSTKVLRRAAVKAVDVQLDEMVEEDSRLVKWRLPQLILTLLDTPNHMMR